MEDEDAKSTQRAATADRERVKKKNPERDEVREGKDNTERISLEEGGQVLLKTEQPRGNVPESLHPLMDGELIQENGALKMSELEEEAQGVGALARVDGAKGDGEEMEG